MNIQEEVARRVRNGITALKSELRASGVDETVLNNITIAEHDNGVCVLFDHRPIGEQVSEAPEVDELTGAVLSEPVARRRKSSKQDDGDAE